MTSRSSKADAGSDARIPSESASRVIAERRPDSRPPPSATRAAGSVEAPPYLQLLEEKLAALLVPSLDARVAHLRCLSGLAADAVADVLTGAHLVGIDEHEGAIAVARRQAGVGAAAVLADYRVGNPAATGLPAGAFSHAFTLRAPFLAEERQALFAEMARLLAPTGQAVVVMPMRGSFTEVFDLLLELALKRDAPALAGAVEKAIFALPTVEDLATELESVGLASVDVGLDEVRLSHGSGRALFEDPAVRGLLRPELAKALGPEAPADAFAYVAMAIDRYFESLPFSLGLRLAGATARRR